MTKRVVPPAFMVLGVNDLEIVGRLGVIGSESAAVQVPPVQPAPVLVTPAGTEMNAVLVTCVCASAGACSIAMKESNKQPNAQALAGRNFHNEKKRRSNTFFLIFTKITRK
jgi:hypothetical protein